MRNRPEREIHRFVYIEWFRQIFKRPALICQHGAVEVGMCGYDDNRQSGCFPVNRLKQFQTTFPGHANIADENIRLLPWKQIERLVSRTKGTNGYLRLLKRLFQYPADRGVIIDNPNTVLTRHVPA